MAQKFWLTHDFAVKMLDWSPLEGLGRRFPAASADVASVILQFFTILNQQAWAVDQDGRALEGTISDRWLSEECPRLVRVQDDEDRKRLSRIAAQ